MINAFFFEKENWILIVNNGTLSIDRGWNQYQFIISVFELSCAKSHKERLNKVKISFE